MLNAKAGMARGAFEPLRSHDFRLFFANSVLASVAMSVRTLVHGWLVLELSGDSALWVGVSAALVGVGQVAGALGSGVATDRFQRRVVLIVEQLSSAVVVLLLAVALRTDNAPLWLAMALSPVIGVQRSISFTGMNRFIYDLVGPQRLVRGAALWRISNSPMVIFGSLLAGALIGWAGIWAAYAFMGAVLLVSPAFLLGIRTRGDVAVRGRSVAADMASGLRFARQTPAVRTLFGVSLVMETLGFSFLIMVPVVAKNVLDAGPMGLGLLSAAGGVGSFVALLVVAVRGDFANRPRVIFVNAFAAGVALLAFSFSRSLPLSMVLAMVVMGTLMAYDLTLGALLQLLAPAELRGRIASLHTLAIAFTAFGGFLAGAIGNVIGVPLVLLLAGAGISVNALLRRRGLLALHEERTP